MIIKQTQGQSSFLPLFLLVLPLCSLFGVILLSPPPLLAETRYVKPSAELAVRRGQGVDFKITAMVKDGASVELLEENGDYARVRLANGKEGWMLRRFLSATPPLVEVVASLRSEKERLEAKESELMQSVEELSANLAQTRTELDTTFDERNRIRADFQNLQLETADVIRIKKDLVQTGKENERLAGELASARQKSEKLKKNFAIKWFLAGGGVLLLGILIGGVMSGKSRRRKSLQL